MTRKRTDRQITKIAVISETDAKLGIYGIDELENLGYEILSPRTKILFWPEKIINAVEHRLGFKVFKIIQALPLIHKADIVLCIFEPYGEFAALLKRARFLVSFNKPLIVMSCWLGEKLSHRDSRVNDRFARNFKSADLITVFSKNQIELFTKAGFDSRQIEFLPFGYAPSHFDFSSGPDEQAKIVAIGWDRGRDYATMFKALEGKPYSIDLYCGEHNLTGLQIPQNVTWKGKVPFEEYKNVLRQASIVIVPTKNLAYPTGQTVALEAAASGCCLILADTKPMREYFSDKTALFYTPGSYSDLAEKLDSAITDSSLRKNISVAARKSVTEEFTYFNMWKKFDTLVSSLNFLK